MVTRFYDNNRGSDSNDGLTPETALKSLTLIDDAAAAAGDMYLLADDSAWDYDIATRIVPPNTWMGTRSNPVVIGKYSPSSQSPSSQKPLIRWNRRIAANEWTYSAPNNAWAFTSPNNVGALCLLRLSGGWSASYVDAGLPLASVDGRYFASGTTLYLYAPSSTNPTDYYGEVLLSTNAGFITISTGRRWVVVEDLAFEDTGTGILGFSDASATETGCIARGISGHTVSGLVRMATGASAGALRGFIQACEISDWGAVAFNAFSAGNTGFLELDISRNRIDDGMHCYSQGAIYLQARSPDFGAQVHHNRITRARYGSRDKIFDGCAIYAETGSDNADIYANLIEDCYVAMQDNSGRGNRWRSNIVRNCWTAMRASDQNGNNAMNLTFEGNACIVGDSRLSPAYGAGHNDNGLRVYKESGTAVELNIRNNVFVKRGEQSARAAVLTPQVAWSGSLDNNAYVGFPAFARREYSPFTLESASGTVSTDPMLDSVTHRPLPGSPLIGAGAYVGKLLDASGKRFARQPSIGAFEFVKPRAART